MKGKTLVKFDETQDTLGQLLYFILDSARRESPLKLSGLVRGCAVLSNEKALGDALSDLGNDLQDIEKECQKLISEIRERGAGQVIGNDEICYFFEALEDRPLPEKMQLLGSLNNLVHDDETMTVQHHWMAVHNKLAEFEFRFDTLLHKIRNGHWTISNAEAERRERLENPEKYAGAAHA